MNKYNSRDKCNFKALEDDKVCSNGKTIRHPIYRNEDGFMPKHHPSEGQNQIYISDDRYKIGGEFYPTCLLLIHCTHHRLAHYGVNKTYSNISHDTLWPGQWEDTKRFVKGCHTCHIIKLPTQRPADLTQMMQVPERPWRSISMCKDVRNT